MKQPQLARYEGGQQPDPATIVKIATTCGVTVDWLLTGVTLALPRARSDMDCQSALEAAIAGAPLKLRRIAGPKVDRAWSNMPTEQKDEIKDYLRRAALVAIAVERLLPPQAAKPVIDALSAQVTLAIIAKILK